MQNFQISNKFFSADDGSMFSTVSSFSCRNPLSNTWLALTCFGIIYQLKQEKKVLVEANRFSIVAKFSSPRFAETNLIQKENITLP